jgi:hypothetical protein
MKKIITLLSIALFSNGILSQNSYTASQVSSSPTIDGDGNDAVWADANWQNINQVWIPYNNILPSNFTVETGTKVLNGASDFTGKYKIVWSQATSYLYFLVEIQDDAFIDGYQKPMGNYPNYDVLELFIDENKSGGRHLFDNANENAENAFAYHIAVTNPGNLQTTTSMVGAMDVNGSNYNVVDYQSHFPSFAFKNYGIGKYVYEFSLKLYKDNYSPTNPASSLRTNLNVDDVIGLSIAYCDNDDADGKRDHFIGSVTVTGSNNNNSYIDASIFGELVLGPATSLNTDTKNAFEGGTIFPNPFSRNFQVKISNEYITKDTKINIYDLFGREVASTLIKNTDTTISMSNFKPGLYFYSLISDNEVITKGKLISE